MLSGIKAVEICGMGPGPFCGMRLADLDADVIAVERADASLDRADLANHGKRSIVADLKTLEGHDMVLRLVEYADALIEGMLPRVMERLGLGPDACRARNPRLVYGRMTGWGQTSSLSQAAGNDNNDISVSGALYLVIGLLAGILKARTTGKGTVVDATIVSGSAHMLQLLPATRQFGWIRDERGQRLQGSSHLYATYRCADDNFITIGSIEPQFYALLLEKLGWNDDARFQQQWDASRWLAMHKHFAELFATRTCAEWNALLEGADVCFGHVLSPCAGRMTRTAWRVEPTLSRTACCKPRRRRASTATWRKQAPSRSPANTPGKSCPCATAQVRSGVLSKALKACIERSCGNRNAGSDPTQHVAAVLPLCRAVALRGKRRQPSCQHGDRFCASWHGTSLRASR